MHWTNALAMVVMVLSGWQIYDASPLFNFRFPHSITLGGWLGGGLLWHFAAMWVLAINGILYIALGFITGRFRKMLLPIRIMGLISDTKAALHGTLSHEDLSMYNHVQRLLYVGILAVAVVIVLSGLSMWKPVQFQSLAALFGGYDGARYVHFICMGMIVAFLAIHVTLALLFPKSIRAMLIGS
jgi:thiosulfate reductase cytochrome b subunit